MFEGRLGHRDLTTLTDTCLRGRVYGCVHMRGSGSGQCQASHMWNRGQGDSGREREIKLPLLLQSNPRSERLAPAALESPP